MQQATHPRLHVRDAHDAHTIFEAVRQGFLPPILRRLNDAERATLVRPGAIFVWLEGEDDAGLRRWTDGRIWGQSRMREPYLFYDEKLPSEVQQPQHNSAKCLNTFRFVDSAPRTGPSSSAISHHDRAAHHHSGLVKQAYSAWVTPDPRAKSQKWHLTAYFTYSELPTLPTVDRDPLLAHIIVPSGIYRSSSARSKPEEVLSSPRRPSLSSAHSDRAGDPSTLPRFMLIEAARRSSGDSHTEFQACLMMEGRVPWPTEYWVGL